MTLSRANTLAFGLIGKDGPHGIIKICFWNMNLVFRSEVALLGFWEYMFQILFRVRAEGIDLSEKAPGEKGSSLPQASKQRRWWGGGGGEGDPRFLAVGEERVSGTERYRVSHM
jgi:hypothetical protein